MGPSLLTTAALASALLLAPAPATTTFPLDLQDRANQKLKDPLHAGGFAENHLGELPSGKQKFAGVPFVVGDKLVQLGSTQIPDTPAKVEGIQVALTCARLHFFHGTGYTEPDGTVIGKYVVRYDDRTEETIPIVYGDDVRDWWGKEGEKVSRGKLAWEGDNPSAKANGSKLRLYLLTWKNPHVNKKIVTIDYLSEQTKAAPFCVAITADKE